MQYSNLVRQHPTTQHYSWAIARLGAANEKSRIVGRYVNRQDAEDSLRLLKRFLRRVPNIHFVLIFIEDD